MLYSRLQLSILVLTVLAPARAGLAVEWWHDPALGCGTLESWQRTQRMKDLPGCDGELPRGAPPGEVAMHDAKVQLVSAEKRLDQNETANVVAKIDASSDILNRAPSDPRVNWARPHYAKAISILRSRLALAPLLPGLRSSHDKAVAGNHKSPAAKTAAAKECVKAFSDAESAGVDLSIQVELTPGQLRPLSADRDDCAERAKPADQGQ